MCQDLVIPDIYKGKIMKMNVNLNELNSVSVDLHDVMKAIPEKIRNKPKDTEGTEITIGECLDDIRSFINGLLTQVKGDRSSHWLDNN